jgi:hypothetical protein
LQAGTIIGRAWELYKSHWRHLVPVALIVYVLVSLLELLLVALLGWVGLAAALFIAVAGIFWIQGALVVAVDDIRDGRADLGVSETISRIRGRLNTLTLAGLLAVLGVTIGLVLLIVPGLFLLTIWLLIVPAIVLEGHGVFSSFGRSRELVNGYGWSVFGVIVLSVLIWIGVGIGFGILDAALDNVVASFVLDIASQGLIAPFIALTWTLTYYELRTLKEPAPIPSAA